MNWNERASGALASLDEIENAADGGYPYVEDELGKVYSYIRESAKKIAMLEKALSQAMEISGIELREAIGILQPDGGGSNHPAEFRVFGHPTDAHKYPELAAYLREQDHIVEAQEIVESNNDKDNPNQ